MRSEIGYGSRSDVEGSGRGKGFRRSCQWDRRGQQTQFGQSSRFLRLRPETRGHVGSAETALDLFIDEIVRRHHLGYPAGHVKRNPEVPGPPRDLLPQGNQPGSNASNRFLSGLRHRTYMGINATREIKEISPADLRSGDAFKRLHRDSIAAIDRRIYAKSCGSGEESANGTIARFPNSRQPSLRPVEELLLPHWLKQVRKKRNQ